MKKAFVRVWTSVGDERKAQKGLKKVQHVKMAEVTSGEQDLIVLVEAKTYEKLLSDVEARLRKVPGVRNTITNLVID